METKTIQLKPTFFLIIINPKAFNRKMDAVNFVNQIKKVFKNALIKMVGEHQYDVEFIKNQPYDLKLWGCGRDTRALVKKVLDKLMV